MLASRARRDSVRELNTHGHTVEEWREIRRRYERTRRVNNGDTVRARERRSYLKNKIKKLQYQAAYRVTNRAKVLEDKKRWQRNNWECRQQYMKRWCSTNAQSIKARKHANYIANKQSILAKQRLYVNSRLPIQTERRNKAKRKWELENRERTRPMKVAYAVKRRALKLSALVKGDKADAWIIEVKNRETVVCYYCDAKIPGKKCHIDHILALSKGGKHCIANLCTSCQRCNQSKGNRLIPKWEKAGQQIFSL